MNSQNFKLEHVTKDAQNCELKIWSGPSLKQSFYKNIGVDSDKDRIFYIETKNVNDLNNNKYRFTYKDQIKLFDLVINNKQIPTAKIKYILQMVEKLFSWFPQKHYWYPDQKKELEKIISLFWD